MTGSELFINGLVLFLLFWGIKPDPSEKGAKEGSTVGSVELKIWQDRMKKKS